MCVISLRRAGCWLGIGAANVITVLHPDLVVIGGGVSEAGDLLLEPMRKTVRERVGMFPTDGVRIERSALGDRAGLLRRHRTGRPGRGRGLVNQCAAPAAATR